MAHVQTQVWKKAIEIYADISELSVKNAISHLDTINELSFDLKQAVITLINSGNQASQYIHNSFSVEASLTGLLMPVLELGSQIGEYKLLEKLGEGGMSQVFKSRRINKEHQKLVAIKIFSPINNSLQLREHFIAEQKILSELDHENIVTMLHGGKTKDNTTYLVMELIENALPINQYIKKHQTSTHNKIAYILQCAKALGYSHANLVIHRDLKPDNILIDKNDKLKIVDFGIAKLISNKVDNNNTTIMALTPNYAAPEQVNSEKTSVATDVFSLAVVALELLVGEQFLPKDRLIKSCANDEKVILTVLKSLKVDKDLKNILNQALQQDPKNRYASMQSFADDLDNYLQQKPVKASAQSMFYRLKKFASRHKALFTSIILFIILLITGLIVTTWQYRQIKIESGKAQQVKQFMLDTFNITDPNRSGGNNVSAKDLLRIAAVKLNDNNTMNTIVKFELYQSLAIANDQLGFSQEAIELLKQSLEITPNNTKSMAYLANNYLQANERSALEQLLLNTDETKFISEIDRAKFSLARAKNLSTSGDFIKAIAIISEISNLNNIRNNDTELIIIQQVLAGIYYDKSDYDKSIEILKLILSKSELSQTHTLILSTKLDLGRTYNSMGKHNLALNEFSEIESLYKQILGDKHPDLGGLYFRMASSFKATGQLQQSHKYAQQSYDTNVLVFGNKGAQVAASLNMLSVLAQSDGNIEKAIDFTKKAIVLLEESYSINSLKTLELKTNLAVLFGFNLQHEKSLKILKQVFDIQKNKLGINHFSTLNTEGSIVTALTHLKRTKQAKELAIIHLQRVLKHVNSKSILTVNAYASLAEVYLYTKEKQKRLDTLLEIDKQNLLDELNPYYVMVIFKIAQTYNKLDDIEKAKQYFKKAFTINAKIYSDSHISTLQMKLLYAKFLKSRKQLDEVQQIVIEVKEIIQREDIDNIDLNRWLKQLD